MRNAEASKERILEAAMAEFSAHGIAGARVDRIAKAAGCNKNLIYIYFDNKETLFATLLQKHLLRVYEDIAFTPDDLPGYAARVFDFGMSRPDLMRLLAWYNLEQQHAVPPERGAAHGAKVEELAEAQRAGRVGGAFPPHFLMTAVMTLATAYTAANPFGAPLDADSTKDLVALRGAVSAAVGLLAQQDGAAR
ncbi:TetR family transcriptional regulator [Paenibacillus sp. MWE-103]|uniref:TetR family transcriptional regulator n=1 Tax=Paenibacillus artemisiicola TaxID=1172618 RepID=A0ABS3WJH1_9BACL|nr:TetR family transcriptional regulator [Paenibacillus artemisiicola]MBO7748474.1 TetR family transcriptional regulator [Paenibacillus artemisiicola]